MSNGLVKFSMGSGANKFEVERRVDDPTRVFISIGKKVVSFDLESAAEIGYLMIEATKTPGEDL